MKTQSPDTSIEAERVLIALVRRMPVWRKIQLAEQLGATLRNAIKADPRARNPQAGKEELYCAFVQRWLGTDLAQPFLRARAERRRVNSAAR
jgi:maltooligosyltrehalose synthase